jgi:hypothetical protein
MTSTKFMANLFNYLFNRPTTQPHTNTNTQPQDIEMQAISAPISELPNTHPGASNSSYWFKLTDQVKALGQTLLDRKYSMGLMIVSGLLATSTGITAYSLSRVRHEGLSPYAVLENSMLFKIDHRKPETDYMFDAPYSLANYRIATIMQKILAGNIDLEGINPYLEDDEKLNQLPEPELDQQEEIINKGLGYMADIGLGLDEIGLRPIYQAKPTQNFYNLTEPASPHLLCHDAKPAGVKIDVISPSSTRHASGIDALLKFKYVQFKVECNATLNQGKDQTITGINLLNPVLSFILGPADGNLTEQAFVYGNFLTNPSVIQYPIKTVDDITSWGNPRVHVVEIPLNATRLAKASEVAMRLNNLFENQRADLFAELDAILKKNELPSQKKNLQQIKRLIQAREELKKTYISMRATAITSGVSGLCALLIFVIKAKDIKTNIKKLSTPIQEITTPMPNITDTQPLLANEAVNLGRII